MALQIATIVLFVAIFVIATARKVHIGVLMFGAACAAGIWLADMPLKAVVGGFPIGIMVLLVGVTYFFGIAHCNGTIDRVIEAALVRVGDRAALLPLVFFLLTGGIAAMGSPLGGLVMAPVGMTVADKRGIDPMLMGLAMGTGLSAGAFAPTSLFGIVAYGTAHQAGIALSPMVLFAIALVVNLVLFAAAFVMFGGIGLLRTGTPGSDETDGGGANGGGMNGGGPVDGGPVDGAPTPRRVLAKVGAGGASGDHEDGVIGDGVIDGGVIDGGVIDGAPAPLPVVDDDPVGTAHFTTNQRITLVSMVGLVVTVVGMSLAGLDPDIGVLSFAFGAVLTLIDAEAGAKAVSKIDWSTVLLVGGILTYVGVLEHMGAVDLLGDFAGSLSVPILAALFICLVGGLVSAFASTTGMLAALVPLALPLIATGGIPGWALISALAVCASIVDVSPFSTVGATLIATTADADQHPRMTRLLMRWGLSMVVIGPVVLVGALVVPSMLF